MRKSRIKAKLNRNEAALCTQLHLIDASVYELTSLMGFDGIWMDLEHHTYSIETATALMRAARVGNSDILARPAKGEFARVARLLEAGAQGIMYPRCDDAAEAAEVVKWAKFAPMGKRGFDGGNPDMPYCSMPISEYITAANDETFIVIQIEEQQALKNVEAIAEVDAVDVVSSDGSPVCTVLNLTKADNLGNPASCSKVNGPLGTISVSFTSAP